MIQLGQTFVGGRSRETAAALLRAARQVGVDSTRVKTVQDGYMVPDAVADAYNGWPGPEGTLGGELGQAVGPELKTQPVDLSELKFNELRSLARERGLSPAGTKDDLIARLTAEESE